MQTPEATVVKPTASLLAFRNEMHKMLGYEVNMAMIASQSQGESAITLFRRDDSESEVSLMASFHHLDAGENLIRDLFGLAVILASSADEELLGQVSSTLALGRIAVAALSQGCRERELPGGVRGYNLTCGCGKCREVPIDEEGPVS